MTIRICDRPIFIVHSQKEKSAKSIFKTKNHHRIHSGISNFGIFSSLNILSLSPLATTKKNMKNFPVEKRMYGNEEKCQNKCN